MKKYLILTVSILSAIILTTQCQRQNYAMPSNVTMTADKHRDLVRTWVENMDKQSRMMEDIKCYSDAVATAAEIRELGREIKIQKETIEAPLTKRVYEQVMNLPEFRERINTAMQRNAAAKKSLRNKECFKSAALWRAL